MKAGFLIAIIVLFSGCICLEPTCNPPYIAVGNECCLDANNDSICDKDQPVYTTTSTAPSATTSSTLPARITTTSTSTTLAASTTTLQHELNVTLEVVYLGSIMSGVYNQYPDLNTSLLTYTVTNDEDKPVKLTFVSEILDYTSQSRDMYILEPHETYEIVQNPMLKPGINVREMVNANIYYKVTDSKGEILDEETLPTKLYAKDTMIWATWDGESWVDTSPLIGAWVTPHDPEIDKLIRMSAEYHPDHSMEGYQCSDCVTDDDWNYYTHLQVKAIYDALQDQYKITYINAPIAYSSEDLAPQRVKLPKDSITLASANCIDGTVLFASALESVGINSHVILLPDHAFVCWDACRKCELVDCLETTMIGSRTFDDAEAYGVDEYNEAYDQGSFEDGDAISLSVHDLRAIGIMPMS